MINIIILLAYVSLVIELVFFPVPSVASTFQLVNNKSYSENQKESKGEIGAVKNWNVVKKLFLLIFPAFINVLLFMTPLILLYNRDWLTKLFPMMESSWILIIAALALIVLGRMMTFSSVLQIRKENQQKGNSFKLHQKAWFRFSRNPGLVGMYLFFLGLLLIFPSMILLFGFIFYVCYMHYKVLLEEDFLSKQFGSDYINYLEKSRRYV